MTILYSLVARGKTVLSEFTFTSGNFPTITRLLLAKIDCGRDGKVSYVYDQYVFHYLCDDGILYLCMCDDDQHQKRRIPFAFLDDIKQRFLDANCADLSFYYTLVNKLRADKMCKGCSPPPPVWKSTRRRWRA